MSCTVCYVYSSSYSSVLCFFFFSSRRRHTRCSRDWSSDVCSSDLLAKDNEEPMLSVSVGVASYPKDADTIGTLLYAADRALYGMKEKRARAAGAGQGS